VSEEKFSKCEEKGGKKENYKCRISDVRKKRKVLKRKKIKVFWKKFEVKDFAKFVFTVGFFLLCDSSITWAN